MGSMTDALRTSQAIVAAERARIKDVIRNAVIMFCEEGGCEDAADEVIKDLAAAGYTIVKVGEQPN